MNFETCEVKDQEFMKTKTEEMTPWNVKHLEMEITSEKKTIDIFVD